LHESASHIKYLNFYLVFMMGRVAGRHRPTSRATLRRKIKAKTSRMGPGECPRPACFRAPRLEHIQVLPSARPRATRCWGQQPGNACITAAPSLNLSSHNNLMRTRCVWGAQRATACGHCGRLAGQSWRAGQVSWPMATAASRCPMQCCKCTRSTLWPGQWPGRHRGERVDQGLCFFYWLPTHVLCCVVLCCVVLYSEPRSRRTGSGRRTNSSQHSHQQQQQQQHHQQHHQQQQQQNRPGSASKSVGRGRSHSHGPSLPLPHTYEATSGVVFLRQLIDIAVLGMDPRAAPVQTLQPLPLCTCRRCSCRRNRTHR
jgi:hypothetical protein